MLASILSLVADYTPVHLSLLARCCLEPHCRLLIIDDLGYLPQRTEESEVLFILNAGR